MPVTQKEVIEMTKLNHNIKKIIVVALIVSVVCVIIVGGLRNKNYNSEVQGDITVENVACIINDNLAKQGKHLTMGSRGYISYLKDILMYDSDKGLKESPYYKEIKKYAANYIDWNEITAVEFLSPNYFLAPFREIPADMKGKKIKELPVEK